MQNVLMVCLGNICRSPVADGILRQKAEAAGLDIKVDSCGTSNYHIGEAPDSRSQANALDNCVDISMLRARQFHSDDFDHFDRIYVMDHSNRDNVLALARTEADSAKVRLILEHSHPGKEKEVPDPYFGGAGGFQTVFDLLNDACDIIIKELS